MLPNTATGTDSDKLEAKSLIRSLQSASVIHEMSLNAQADLLSYFGQQAIAHAATLFAVLTAAFTFMSQMQPRGSSLIRLRRLVFVIVSSVLLMVGFYALFRTLYYGAVVTYVILIPSGELGYAEYSKILYDQMVSGPYAWLASLGFARSFTMMGLTISLFSGFVAASLAYFVVWENASVHE